jgi:hypothetical protein
MVDVVREWAGKERLFRLNFGGVLDLEQATGDGIGNIFLRVVGGTFHAGHVYHTIRLALIGAGMGVLDAKRVMDAHFDTRPYLENASLAGEILTDLMSGVEPIEDEEGGEEAEHEPHKFSEVSQICRTFNLSPLDLRDMRYADFANMVRGFNAASDRKAPHLTEDEFIDILNRYEPEAVQ